MTSPTRFPSRRSVILGGAAALGTLPLIGRRASAAEWPTKPVKFVVTFAAGGTTDILARVVAQKLSEEYGQQFIVENKAGAGGNIAADFVAKAEGDGYTFLVGAPGVHATNKLVFKNMPFDPGKDLASVSVLAKVPNLMSVTNSMPAKSVKEFIDLAKAKPDEYFYASPGLGTTAHLATELFKSMTGVKLTHVPYKGSAPALTDLIGGRVHVMIDNLPAAQTFAEGNQIRALAVSTAKRWEPMKDLPSIAEAGVPGYDAASWFTVAAPAKTSKEIVGKLSASIDKFVKSDDGKARMIKLGADPVGGTPAEMDAFIQSEIEKWTKVAQFAGIKPE
ncbi:Bug family tripartite tricarboxylate transporter substrate binding protein [Tardiphaga sp.]|jgi:tripartite-type tricarboxylate transporter receptor subunit TctC|uniref:Bug family tripartite tricarboxylate transporter substrate binding protein n=1 Tax=Tardiphaga sp. TaxID=1926292 RepID=UPI0037DA76FD